MDFLFYIFSGNRPITNNKLSSKKPDAELKPNEIRNQMNQNAGIFNEVAANQRWQ